MKRDAIAVVIAAALVAGFCLVALAQDCGQIPEGTEYIDKPQVCGMCHEHKDETAAFEETPHFKHEAPEDADDPWRHSTGYNPETEEAAHEGIGCQACHGPAGAHMKAKTGERAEVIVNSMYVEDNDVRISICAQCHAQYKAKDGGDAPVAYVPGENLLEKIELLPVEEGKTHQQVNEMATSKHYTVKKMGCIQCHSSHAEEMVEHNLRKDVPDLCLGCHHEQEDMAHTKGAFEEGDTCVTCHMVDGTHTFTSPGGDDDEG